MSTSFDKQFADSWRQLLDRAPPLVAQQVAVVARRNQGVLADHFYEQLLKDTAASRLISHELVRARLHSSLQRWIVAVFDASPGDDLDELVQRQRHVGRVHARVDVPVHLVLRGARGLKQRLSELIQQQAGLTELEGLDAVLLVHQVVDLTMEIMSHAYASSHDRNSRAQEAYRLFAVVQNVAAERQRQRAALLDWENKIMFELAVGQKTGQMPRIGTSEFGLWFRHKGAHAFQGTEEAGQILMALNTIDETLLPQLAVATDPAQRQTCVHELRDQAQAIGLRLEALFRQTNEIESGRDALTRLLNRKYLPVVLSKELSYVRQHDTSFAVLAIDVDHFKLINDTHGHAAGDLVLQQLAVLLGNSSRAGDYIFRLGGEEFLALLVDTEADAAFKVAESLRQDVEREVFRLSDTVQLRVTVSIGVAMYDGHPDYEHMLRRADEALYEAKHAGRNRVVRI